MIIPINNGSSIIPIYIPPAATTTSDVLEESNTTIQNNEPTLVSWIVLGVVLIFLIAFGVCLIKSLKNYFGDEDESKNKV